MTDQSAVGCPATALSKCRFRACRATTRGHGRQGPEFLQRSGGIAAGLGAVHEQVLPIGVRNVWNVELVPV